MNKKLNRLLEPSFAVYFFVMLLFTVITTFFDWRVATGELAAVLLLFIGYRIRNATRRKEMIGYIETLTHHIDSAANDSMVNFPLPMLIVSIDSNEVIWANAAFNTAAERRENLFTTHLQDMVPDFDVKWLIEGKTESPALVTLNGLLYRVCGNIVRPAQGAGTRLAGSSLLAMLYFFDITEFEQLKKAAADSRPVFGILMVDNYDELFKNMTESTKSSLMAAVDDRVLTWLSNTGALIRRYDRDRYLFVVSHATLTRLTESKFSVLDSVREISAPESTPITLSIGIGDQPTSFHEAFGLSQLAIDMAQARGGDQAVIKDQFQFSFFGGHSKELEKRTKVKSRIMANTLKELIIESDQLYIMGHANSDIDSVGAAVGIACIARRLGKQASIVLDRTATAATVLIDKLAQLPTYQSTFITPQDAIVNATAATLLVVVDTSRTDFVESPQLLQALHHVAVIDHHRRSSNYIERATLSFHEPYASSASELVTELMTYLLDPNDVHRVEAEALLGGIMLDTKNFSMHTGTRTFEAAAYLRSAGADTVAVKKLFQTDLSESLLRYDIIRSATLLHEQVAVAALEQQVPPYIAAQAADQLLEIRNISASFVLIPHGDGVNISARSLDRINVQVICEKLGGGGHMTIAGAQLTDIDIHAALRQLTAAIDQYFEEAGDPS